MLLQGHPKSLGPDYVVEDAGADSSGSSGAICPSLDAVKRRRATEGTPGFRFPACFLCLGLATRLTKGMATLSSDYKTLATRA